MRVLVTGGAGFIGSHVAEALVEHGHDVVVLDDLSTGRRENVPAGAHFVRGDLRSDSTLEKLFGDFRFDAISHQGAQTSVSVSTREPVRDGDVNVLGSLRLLGWATRTEVARFVFASTGGAIYGEVPEGRRAHVADPTLPSSPYACSKLAFEVYLGAAARDAGYPSTILRYANVYGPRQDPHGEAGVVAIFSQRLLDGVPLQINARAEKGDRGCIRDYIYVEDVVAANLAALEGRFRDPVVNVGTGEPTSTRDLAESLCRFAGAAPQFVFADRRSGDLERSVLDPSPIPGLQKTTSLDSGLQATFAWFRDRCRTQPR
ncbi:MAG TPA: NAD-dependent epimerase/dehydratase family protein [Myxococcales bacterium LLY-WYZ-16_1]|nr:NAD-dependent epimerase/dehydratase family protein [Myxococcales bacterium LLY-WYZ-16_1]